MAQSYDTKQLLYFAKSGDLGFGYLFFDWTPKLEIADQVCKPDDQKQEWEKQRYDSEHKR